MLLDDLVGTIETLKLRIVAHGASLRQNEIRTRAALIDPLLQALGWDTTDPALVTPEYRVDIGWADYALLGVGNKPAAVVEAKRLGSIVENHLDQAVGYCIQHGIAYVGVTDGNNWQLYRTFEPVALVDKLVLDVSIADTPAHEAALKLLLLWRPNASSGQSVEANTPVFADSTNEGPLASAPGTLLSPDLPPVGKNAEDWNPLSQVFPDTGDSPPSRIRMADGTEESLRRAWAAVVESTAAWLWSKELLISTNVPVQSSNRRFIVNTQPRHPEGNEFNQPAQIDGTPLWVERNISGQAAISNTKKLLEICSVSLDKVLLRFD